MGPEEFRDRAEELVEDMYGEGLSLADMRSILDNAVGQLEEGLE
jgi:hypothetical protein